MSLQAGWVEVIVGGVSAGVAAIATFFTGRRKTSGNIDTSTPGEIWTAEKVLRDGLVAEIERLRVQVTQLLAQVNELQARIAKYESGPHYDDRH